MSIFADGLKTNTSFIVKNISSSRKTIKIFNLKIAYNQECDLLAIPGISEEDIRVSLLRGQLKRKLDYGQITIIASDINLLQFNADQRRFLESHGVSAGTTLTGAGGIPEASTIIYVDFLSDLLALEDSALVDGTVAFVNRLQSLFTLNKTSTSTEIPAVIIGTDSGVGNWHRIPTPSKTWASQSTWYLDSVAGDDENDGLTSSTALLTHAELMRRFAGSIVTSYPTINVINPIVNEDININVEVGPTEGDLGGAAGIYYVGVPTVVFTGTITAVTNINSSTNQDGLITDSALPTSWTASDGVGRLVRITGGDRAGTEFWIISDQGSKTARISQPVATPFLEDLVDLQVGDPYEVLSFPQFGNLVNISISGSAGKQVNLQYLKAGSSLNAHSVEIVLGLMFNSSCLMYGFDITAPGSAQLYNCKTLNGFRCEPNSSENIMFGGISSGLDCQVGASITVYNASFDSGGEIGIRVGVNASVDIGTSAYAAFYNCLQGIQISSGGKCNNGLGSIFGKTVANAIVIYSGGLMLYAEAHKPSYITSGSNLVIGGTNRSWAQIPFVETNGAAMLLKDSPIDPLILHEGSTIDEFNSMIIAASALAVSTGIKQIVQIEAGRYEFTSAVVLNACSNIAIIGAGEGRTVFAADVTWTPSVGLADDPTNYLVSAQGEVGGSDFTTTTAACYTDEMTITTVAAPTVDAWYLLRSGSGATGYPGISWGTGHVRAEPVRVKTVTGVGPYTVTFYSPIEQCHASGSSLRTLTPIQNLSIEGITFDCSGRTFANAIYARGCVDLHVDVAVSGFSRAGVEVEHSTRVTGLIKNLGEVNSPLLTISAHRVTIEHDFDDDSALAWSHTNGIPRGVAYTSNSMHCEVRGRIGHCTGLEFKGLGTSRFDVMLEDCDWTDRQARDTTLFGASNKIGGVLMNNSNPNDTVGTEIPYDLSGRIRIINCRVPDTTGNALQVSACFVDSIKIGLDLLEIVNDGRSPAASGAKVHGIMFYDTAAYDGIRINTIRTVGVEHALVLYGGGNRWTVGEWEHTPSAGAVGGSYFIDYGHQTAGSGGGHGRIGRLLLAEEVAHFSLDHAGSSGINHDSLREIVLDRVEVQSTGRIYDDVRCCLDVSGLADFAGQAGDVSEICPPRACTLANTTDTFTLVGHDFSDGTPVYLGGTVLPGGYTAGTILYVRASDRAAGNTTFELSAAIGGGTFNFSSDGTALTIAPSYRTVRAPTSGTAFDKGTKMTGGGWGLGLALPLRHYWVAFGKRKPIRMDAVQVLNGDRVKAVSATLTGTIDNASTDPLGIAQGKPLATAGLVQLI